ncbi:hypothetical protein AB5W95_001476 [Neisseria gonorrhoeae]|uniref:hypothetical protein n=1 Tax=Neisseria gonorrhoeae TaxID=485 RepID=UPI0021DF4826|nr:hypothetical protein [Neisseria gonorrhoeae]MCU9832968.1 hypothetical protein [Neisseria gonorrhoeae]MCU9845618.1 hypothetical protein [Neisseria gonorrhoeae]MCU9851751.1 hypothetical protein [Neisseria gonorrhoeae]MCU9880739.1 hypothetical protein [Neisseria gonorrhoeae]MCU9913537.1 hypothetical protein [Neisseria gonorrhoeae]
MAALFALCSILACLNAAAGKERGNNAAAGKEGGNGFPAFGGGVGGVVPDVRRHIFGKINFNIRQLSEYLLKFRIFRTGTLGAYVQFVGMEFLGIWG